MSINQGDSLYLSIVKYDDDGNETSFEQDEQLKFAAKRKLNQPNYDIESENAKIIDGIAIIEIPPEKTNIRLGDYYYDIQYTTSNYDKYTIVKGTLTIEWDVND